MKRGLALTLILALGGLADFAVGGADASALWARQVQPLLDVRCTKCHGLLERKGGLELVTPESVLKGGDEGAVVKPGDPDGSPLYQALAPGSDPHMPPKKQLTEAERDVVRAWIAALGDSAGRSAAAPLIPATRSFGSVTEAVDRCLEEGWARSGLKPAAPADERTWCRRVYLDLAGRIPTPAEVESYLASPGEGRRTALVDRLLASREYPVRMRELWDVLLLGRGKRDSHDDRRKQNGWWAFLERSFATNQPWNETVRQMLVARPVTPEAKGASWFLYERRNDHQAMAEAVAPLIYGTRIDCAQCHDHPLAREIKQAHYWGLVAAFNRSKNVEGGAEIAESAIGGFVNFTNLKKESQPAVIALLTGRTLDEGRPAGEGKEEDNDDKYVDPTAKVRVPKFSRREALADAATRENPLLARAFVNRLWAVLFGRGLVHPVDEMTARNAPSHPELLDWLAEDFATNRYDVRRLIRGLVLSRPYALGRGGGVREGMTADAFAEALERPLSAEQLARSWRVAAGIAADDEALRRAVAAAIPEVLPREYQATFQQAQFLTHAPALADLVKPGSTNTTDRLARGTEVQGRVRDAFLAVLGRLPEADEEERVEVYLKDRSERPAEGVRDVLWALMTSAEFLTLP